MTVILARGRYTPTSKHGGSESESSRPVSTVYMIAKEVLQLMPNSIQALGEIVSLIKLAMDIQNAPQIRVCEAATTLSVQEEHVRTNGVTAPVA